MLTKQWIAEQKADKGRTLPVLSFPAVQKLGVSVTELISDADLQAQAMKTVADLCPMSAALSMMDLSVEAEAFGSELKFADDDVAAVKGRIITSLEDAENLEIPKIGAGRTAVYAGGINKAKALIKDRPVFAGVIGPYSLAGRLMDITEIMIACYTEPETVHLVLKKAAEFIRSYIELLRESGADGVVMAEPVAGLLSPELCETFSSAYIRDMITPYQETEFIFVYHNCGNVVPCLEGISSLGADAYHFGNSMDMTQIMELMPKDQMVMGNIDPVLFRHGTPDEMKTAVTTLLNACSKYENFVISTGCDLPPASGWDNIKAYFEAVDAFYH